MNLFHVTVLEATLLCLCYGFGILPSKSPSRACPATAVTTEEFTDTFVGTFVVLYNVSAMGPNDKDCFYYVFNPVDPVRNTSSLAVLSETNGYYYLRNASIAIRYNRPLLNTFTDNGEQQLLSGSDVGSILVATQCSVYGISHLVASSLSDYSSNSTEMDAEAAAAAQTIVSQMTSSLSVSAYAVDNSNCEWAPTR